jgi:hypothetical protein
VSRAAVLLLLAITATMAPSQATEPVPFAADGTPIELGRGHDLPSRILGDDRRINVLLPEGYERSRSGPGDLSGSLLARRRLGLAGFRAKSAPTSPSSLRWSPCAAGKAKRRFS